MVKLGTYLNRDETLTVEERLRIIKSMGFDFIALGMSALVGDQLGEHLRLCEKYDLPVDNIHLTGEKTTFLWEEGEVGEEVLRRYCREIEYCASAGVKVGITHVTWGHKIPAPIGEIGLSHFETIAECAARCGFVLALENSVYPDYLYATMERLRDYNSIGFCFDSGHRNAFAPQENFLETFRDRLVATHIQDNDGANDLHLMPLDGSISWEKVASELARTPVGRDRICAEVSMGVARECPGMTAAEIYDSLHMLRVRDEKDVLRVKDGKFSVYKKLTFEEKMERLYRNLSAVGAMIDACAEDR